MRAERLVFSLTRQLQAPEAATWPHNNRSSVNTHQLDNRVVYLGETCVFDVTLSNQGAPVSALTIKVECSVEGGSTAALYDNSHSPLQQLPFNAQEQLRVQTDIKEQGLISVVASAVFTDQSGERKYHVQFFKFNSASPVSVRTRVRHLPHAITGAAAASTNSSSSSVGCGIGKTRCFLEVNVQNSTQLVMQLHAVRLLAAPGVAAQQVVPLSGPPQQQQQGMLPAPQQARHQQQQQHDQQQPASSSSSKPLLQHGATLAPAGAAVAGCSSSSDTELLQDTDSFTAGSSSSASAAAPSVLQQQQQALLGGYDQPQQQQQQQHLQAPAQSAFAPFGVPGSVQQQQQEQAAAAAATQPVPLPAGCSHNVLWQIDHQLAGLVAAATPRNSSSGVDGPPPPVAAATPSAGGGSGPSSTGGGGSGSSSSSSSSTLGRLELHWSTCDGRTGRLLTQPLTGPVPASGKEVLMQLHQVMPGAPAATVTGEAAQQQQQQQELLAPSLTVNQPFTATFTLTAGPHDMGPLLVLYTTAPPPAASASGGNSSGLASSSSAQLGTDSTSIQARRLGGSGAATGGEGSCPPDVVVQGSRSRRITGLSAGQSVEVCFELLPLRCGWLRLPTFVVASEVDGRLLDGVHDVHVLCVS